MDAGIADTINRRDAKRLAEALDLWDLPEWYKAHHWSASPIAATFMGENDSDNSDRAWLVGVLACRVNGFDGIPADCDWDGFFSYMRAEVLARRDPKTPSVRVAEVPVRDGVGSQ